ncbi:hypothetical protein [Jiangella sp. DSM 45060]|uniref:PKD domain-containing protein n=1 Tax=Jiangella sp. DSM 45060 TaxID=1798224 RepID=UPI00087D609C|nr:hypothetical protein [Jiangella sp. DSM 45060]SDT35737.1 hypothetical protein SAMN04515669_3696 [Jiangella sp. DSM 45060]
MAFIAAETNIGGSDVPGITVLVPAAASAGDLLIVTVTLQADEVTSVTSGLTLVTESSGTTQSAGRIEVYKGTVTSGGALDPGDTILLTIPSSSPWAVSCEAYDDDDVLDFAVSYPASGSVSTVTSPGATATQPCIAKHMYGVISAASVTGSPITWTAHASTTKRVDVCCTNAVAGGTRQGLHMTADETVSGAGAVSGRLATPSSNVQGQSITLLIGTAVAQPTANAGPDQSVAASAVVNLDGSASGGAGAPFTYQWTQTSGTAVTLNDDTAENPTFTAPAASSVLVFSLVVEDVSSVPSPADTVTITVTGAEDIAVPVADVDVAGWTFVGAATAWQALSDGTDATYIVSPENPTDEDCRVDLSELTDPDSGDTVLIRVRARRQDAASATVGVQIVEGASTVRATLTAQAIASGDTFTEFTYQFSPAEITGVVDWADCAAVPIVTAVAA